MRTNLNVSINLSKYKQSNDQNHKYPSKLIADLMNSDSEESDDNYTPEKPHHNGLQLESDQEQENQYIGMDRQSILKYGQQRNKDKSPPPQLISKPQIYKQNMFVDANRNKQQIRYNCYKIDGQKLVEHSSKNNQYNTSSLDQASMIPINNQEYSSNSLINSCIPPLFNDSHKYQEHSSLKNRHYKQTQNDYDPLHPQRFQSRSKYGTSSTNNHTVINGDRQQSIEVEKQLRKNIKKLERQVALLQQQIRAKDNCYEEITEKYKNSIKVIKQNELKFISLNEQNNNLQQTLNKLSISLKQKQQKIDCLSRIKQVSTSSQSSAQIYAQISTYVINMVEQYKNRFMRQKMSAQVENIIEEMMTELVNINKITVSRSKSRSLLVSDNYASRDIKPLKFTNDRTPLKQKNIQRSQQLRNLQKSLHKLRQKQYTPVRNLNNSNIAKNISDNSHSNIKTENIFTNQNYNQLDRSSIMVMDRSINRSKSRRKKIFGSRNPDCNQ